MKATLHRNTVTSMYNMIIIIINCSIKGSVCIKRRVCQKYAFVTQICKQVIQMFPPFSLQGTLDVGLIDSVCASDNPDR